MTHSKRRVVLEMVLISGLLLRCVSSVAYAAASPEAAPPRLDPAAMAALNTMGTYLRTLKAFQVAATTTTDDVTDDGQLVEADATWDILAHRPNKLRVEVTGDDQHRLYLYNGKVVTVWGELANFYATVPAPATISALNAELDDKYDIQLPLTDLFLWGTAESNIKAITDAADYGPSTVDGITCEQYGFRQAGLDWQIWLQRGDYPLPRKIVITTTTDPARPRHSVVLSWNLAPSYDEATFEFEPTHGAHKITLSASAAAAGGPND